jgi:hypothetical protein
MKDEHDRDTVPTTPMTTVQVAGVTHAAVQFIADLERRTADPVP